MQIPIIINKLEKFQQSDTILSACFQQILSKADCGSVVDQNKKKVTYVCNF